MTSFLLIRHGETDMIGKTLAGRMPGVLLNRVGQEQAELLPRRLPLTEISAIYTSPLERARQTAAPLGREKALEVQVSDQLAELDYGEWTGRSFHDLESDSDWQRFNSCRSMGRVPGGETMQEVQVRAMNELERLRRMHQGQTVAVVSHAEWIRSVVLHCLGAPLDLFSRIEISPASVSRVDLSEWGPVVRGLNAL